MSQLRCDFNVSNKILWLFAHCQHKRNLHSKSKKRVNTNKLSNYVQRANWLIRTWKHTDPRMRSSHLIWYRSYSIKRNRTWHKCLPHQDDVSRLRFMSICPYVRPHLHNNHVQTVILSCIDGFWNNLEQMFIIWQCCVMSKNHVPSSKVKVTLIFWRFTLSQLEIIGTHIRVQTIKVPYQKVFVRPMFLSPKSRSF
jgi:hypothetical protein